MRQNWFDSLPRTEQDRIYVLWSEIAHLSVDEQAAAVQTALADSGIQPSRSSVHRKFKEFESRCEALREATQMAERMMATSGDDQNRLSEASLQLAQSLIFQLMLERGEELSPKEIALITRASADAGRGSVSVKKYQAEVKDKLEAAFKEMEGKGGSLDLETLQRVRQEIYGLL